MQHDESSPPATVYLSTPLGSLEHAEIGRWRLSFAGAVSEYESLGDALLEFDSLASAQEEDGYTPEYLVPLEEYVDDETASDVRTVFGWSGNGRSYIDGYWFPSSLLSEFDGPGDHAIYEAGELGVVVTLCVWNEIYLMTSRGIEYGEVEERALGRIDLSEAIEIADAEVFGYLCEVGLNYSSSVGLENLDERERFPLPVDAIPWRRYLLYVGSDDMELKAQMDVYRSRTDPRCWMATATGDSQVVGVYDSEAAVESAVDDSLMEAGQRRGGLEVEEVDLEDPT